MAKRRGRRASGKPSWKREGHALNPAFFERVLLEEGVRFKTVIYFKILGTQEVVKMVRRPPRKHKPGEAQRPKEAEVWLPAGRFARVRGKIKRIM